MHIYMILDPNTCLYDACMYDAYIFISSTLDHDAVVHDAQMYDACIYDVKLFGNGRTDGRTNKAILGVGWVLIYGCGCWSLTNSPS